MRIVTRFSIGMCLAGVATSIAHAAPIPISHQGQLKLNGVPVNFDVDFEVSLYRAEGDEEPLQVIQILDVAVENGLYHTQLSFELQHFSSGAPRWIGMAVRKAGGSSFKTLEPREPLTYAPYALYAATGNEGPQGPQGPAGPVGPAGADGAEGADGLACWDVNGNGIQDASEDSNNDGSHNALDCQGVGGGSHWQQNGSGEIYFDQDWVGVGTDNPAHPFDVAVNRVNGPAIRGTNVGVLAAAGIEGSASSGVGVRGIGTTGVTGTTSSGAGYGVFATATNSTGSNAAVKGTSSSSDGYGVDGRATNANGGIGVYGKHNNTGVEGYLAGQYGAYGEHNAGPWGYLGGSVIAVRGVHGNANEGRLGTATQGVYGKHNSSGNFGYLGSASYGARGDHANGNLGYLAGSVYGAFGRHNAASNYGYLGSQDYGAYGLNGSGAYGWLGGQTVAVQGATPQFDGVGVRGENEFYASVGQLGTSYYGVMGKTNRSNGAGGYFYNTAGGLGLRVAGKARVDVLEIMGGADVAEPFEISDDTKPEPGMVVAIDPHYPGALRVADTAYDRTVAGVVSGANGVRPGLTLTQEGTDADGTTPVALTGRVWVWCDADANGAIAPGDILTSSNVRGHAMKVTDHDRAAGAVIGKAMTKLDSGRGLVLVLVSLQ